MNLPRDTRLISALGRRGTALGALALALASCQGRGATGGCFAPSCGPDPGSPVGTWQVDDVCRFTVAGRPAQNYANTAPYFQPETGATPPATTSGSWCWDLSFDKDGNIMSPAVPMPNPDHVVSGTVTFNEDHTYVYSLTAVSTTPFHIARSCFGATGAKLTCAQFADKLVMSVIGVNPSYANPAGTPAFRCSDAGDGCDCEFDYLESDQSAVGDKGTWELVGDVIHHYSISGQGNLFETSPARRTTRDATFCQNGDSMSLTGANGQPLALKAGTRTLYMSRMPAPDAGAPVGTSGMDAGEDTGAAGTSGSSDSDAAVD
jgi:hypothetical protein